MRDVEPGWKACVLVCTHERPPESGRASCGVERGSALRDDIKKRMKSAGLKGVVLTAKSGCLGVCSPLGVTACAIPRADSDRPRRMWVVEGGDQPSELFDEVLQVLGEEPR